MLSSAVEGGYLISNDSNKELVIAMGKVVESTLTW